MNQLYQIINSTRHNDSPIELLTLTACETAVGSDRDAGHRWHFLTSWLSKCYGFTLGS
jgi:hypothetical protein